MGNLVPFGNSKEQFASSPDLGKALTNAIIDAFAAHSDLSRQALDSETVRDGLRKICWGRRSCTRR